MLDSKEKKALKQEILVFRNYLRYAWEHYNKLPLDSDTIHERQAAYRDVVKYEVVLYTLNKLASTFCPEGQTVEEWLDLDNWNNPDEPEEIPF